MGRPQWTAVAVSAAFLALLAFGFDTKPASFRKVERNRVAGAVSTDAETLIDAARESLEGTEAARVLGLEQQLEKEPQDVETLKALSSAWFQSGQGAIAGYYAAKVAEIEGSAESWSIAGTTYLLALEGQQEEKSRMFCAQGGRDAFERAISLEPDTLRHRINLALLFAAQPPADNPMQGILQLVELGKEHPEDAAIQFHLGRLAIQTGQAEKAVERLTRASELRPGHRDTWCLLAEARQMAGDVAGAEAARKQCDSKNSEQ